MSSDFFRFDEPLYNYQPNSNPIAMFDSDALFHTESSIDSILEEISDEPNAISTTEAQKLSLEEIAQTLLSDSSPSREMENLSLYQDTQFAQLQNFPVSGIKLEETQIPMEFGSLPSSSGSHSYGGCGGESLMKRFLERSYSYGGFCYEEGKQETLFQPPFGALFESPENGFSSGQFGGQMRRVLSTGDLPKMLRSCQATSQNVGSSLLGSESTTTTTTTAFMEEPNFKVGRYSAQERKEKIDRYKAKRTQRNFNKTIKYACRKTLADNRLRIRGRFARNDEAGDKSAVRYDDEDELSVDGLHEEGDHEAKMHEYGFVNGDQRRQYLNHFESYFSQFDEDSIGY